MKFSIEELSRISFLKNQITDDSFIDVLNNNFFQEYVQINKKYEIGIPFRTAPKGDFLTYDNLYCSNDIQEEIIPCLTFYETFGTSSFLEDPVKIDQAMSFRQALDIMANIPDLYGAVLYDTQSKAVFNPLHPVTALTLLDFEKLLKLDEDRFIPVFYKLSSHVLQNKELYNLEPMKDSSCSFSYIMDTILESFIKKDYDVVSYSTAQNADFTQFLRLSACELLSGTIPAGLINVKKNSTYKRKAKTNEELYILVPQQVLTFGRFVPYYGVSLIKNFAQQNEGIAGKSITPMLSSNIGFDWFYGTSSCDDDEEESDTEIYKEYLTSDTFLRFYQKDKLNDYYSVCTGNEDNRLFKSLVNLNHSNANSAYTEGILLPGWLSWAEYAKEYALNIYKEAKWIK